MIPITHPRKPVIGMNPADIQRVRDWIQVREALLARVASLGPQRGNDKDVRPMYTHLLVALRRATVTIIRMIACEYGASENREVTGYDDAGRKEACPSLLWMGTNYLVKICEDTAILDETGVLQNHFGEYFHNNHLVGQETLRGEDARLERDSRVTRWNPCPKRQKFFRGLDDQTLKFVCSVLRHVQRHEEGIDTSSEPAAGDTSPTTAADEISSSTAPDDTSSKSDAREIVRHIENISDTHKDDLASQEGAGMAEEAKLNVSLLPHARPSVNLKVVHAFAERMASRDRARALTGALRAWHFLAIRLRETRDQVDLRYSRRERVRKLALEQTVLAALRKNAADKEHAREAANNMFDARRVAAAKAAIAALAANLERGRALDRSADVLRDKICTARARRAKSAAISSLRQASDDARVVHRRAEELRVQGRERLSLDVFAAWATAAGLAGHLRRRLGRADVALLENVISAWSLFSQHSAGKRLQKQARAKHKNVNRALARVWDAEVLDATFTAWANVTAAGKFRRLRLSSQALRGWREAARASAAGNTVTLLSKEKREYLLAAAVREADARFERAARKHLDICFESWARGAGLAFRLRERLGKAEEGVLMRTAFCGWAMLARHSIRKREARFAAKAARKREESTLRRVLCAWADLTAAYKFYRIRLRHRTFATWRAAVGMVAS